LLSHGPMSPFVVFLQLWVKTARHGLQNH